MNPTYLISLFIRPVLRLGKSCSKGARVCFLLAAMPLAAHAAEPALVLKTRDAKFVVDTQGSLSGIQRVSDGRNYLLTDAASPLLSLRVAGQWHAPSHADYDKSSRRLALHYSDLRAEAVVRVRRNSAYVTFEVLAVECPQRVELVLWGLYRTTIGEIIGETVGVVRDREFALGLQTLNAKTLGGYPTRENDIEEDFNADDHGFYQNLNPELQKSQSYRGDTARPVDKGSVLQAFCRNRDEARVIPNWGYSQYAVPAFRDGGVVGSKIALFAVPADQALATIGKIEVKEGLPHPMLDGEWAKTAPGASASYLIADFSEQNVDAAIAMTRRAGLRYLYHSSPFETWGHFKFKAELFPNGLAGFKACVSKARAAGIRVGFHTLSNFITPNDAYVTPVPDPRLAKVGASALIADISASDKEIAIIAPDIFTNKSALNTVVIDQELVRFATVSAQAPWKLMGCQRGAWGTKATAHKRNEPVARLMDHDYQVFLTDAKLGQEIARNVAGIFNETGARQLSFDGLEGNWSTGYGQYGRTLFVQAWYKALSPDLRGQIINDASNPGHFNWHMQTRMNWGEPWYAGFRESQTLYRFKNQVYFERNYMPHMLGWFALRPETGLEDAEWLLARAAGFDAGFALAVSITSTAQKSADASGVDQAKALSMTDTILDAVNQWETARMAGAFPAEIKAQLRDNSREFHLVSTDQGRWQLQAVHLTKAVLGTNGINTVDFRSSDAPQPLRWLVQSESKEEIHGFTLEINGRPVAHFADQRIPAGGKIKYSGGEYAVISDKAWQEVARVPVDPQLLRTSTNGCQVKWTTTQPQSPMLKVELSTLGTPATLTANRSQNHSRRDH